MTNHEVNHNTHEKIYEMTNYKPMMISDVQMQQQKDVQIKQMKDIFVDSVNPWHGVWNQSRGNGSLQVPLRDGCVPRVLYPL